MMRLKDIVAIICDTGMHLIEGIATIIGIYDIYNLSNGTIGGADAPTDITVTSGEANISTLPNGGES